MTSHDEDMYLFTVVNGVKALSLTASSNMTIRHFDVRSAIMSTY